MRIVLPAGLTALRSSGTRDVATPHRRGELARFGRARGDDRDGDEGGHARPEPNRAARRGRGGESRRATARSAPSRGPACTAPEARPFCTDSTSARSSRRDLVVELEHLGDLLLRDVGAEEVVGHLDHLRWARSAPSARSRCSAGPGTMLIVVFGHMWWNCDCVTSPRGSYAAAAVSSAEARTEPIWLVYVGSHDELVLVRAHVDHLAEVRVRDGAVVALEVVLDRDLPVDLGRPLVVRLEPQRRQVEAARLDACREGPPARDASGSGVGRGVHEHERAPRVDGDGQEREAAPGRTRARARSAARGAACRRARTSTRGTGTGASRGSRCPSPRGGRGGGRR